MRAQFDVDYYAIIPANGISFSLRRAWNAASIFVDNYTPNWLYLQTIDAYVSPYTLGWVGNYNSQSTNEYIFSRDPAGVPTAPAVGFPTGGIRVMLSTELYAPSLGLVYAAAPSTPPVVTVTPPIIPGLPQLGFTVNFLSTIFIVGLVATPCPPTILANRRSLMLQSPVSNTDTIYIGGSGVTADETITGGGQLDPGRDWPIDAASAIPYAIAKVAGQKLIVVEGT